MVKKDIIDTEKKTPSENFKMFALSVGISFAVSMTAAMVVGTCLADESAKEAFSQCWMFFGICFGICLAAAVLQFVFFTSAVVKRMAYLSRMVLFSICLYIVICALLALSGMIPASDPMTWVTFTLSYLVILAVLALLFNFRLSKETRELNEKLSEYRKSKSE